MLTKVRAKNFKKFDDVEIELGNPVVFIGPNDSGKTTALQLISLWKYGAKRWQIQRGGTKAEKKTGSPFPINELLHIPVKEADLLWMNRNVRDAIQVGDGYKPENVLIEIEVEGYSDGETWDFGMDFYYRDIDSFFCRPKELVKANDGGRNVPAPVLNTEVVYLPPMSGLTKDEIKLTKGRIDVLMGEGQTAQVLRNLCYNLLYPNDDPNVPAEDEWGLLESTVYDLFGLRINRPVFNVARGEIAMDYVDQNKITLGLSVSGRGFQQVLLILSVMFSRKNSIILMDEPDAHLEILRQREIYRKLRDIAVDTGNQLIIASHSEVVLREAANEDTVIAFIGTPHPLLGKKSELKKSLIDYNWVHYTNAKNKKWVLYCEGSTDLSILSEFAHILEHKSEKYLSRPFTYYVSNQPKIALKHFFALKEAVPDLKAVAIFDNLTLPDDWTVPLTGNTVVWERNEIENYFLYPDVLLKYASGIEGDDMFSETEREKRIEVMNEIIYNRVPPIALDNPNDPFWTRTKITDDFLDIVFNDFFGAMGIPNELRKGSYYQLASYMQPDEIHDDIVKALDLICEVGEKAEGKL